MSPCQSQPPNRCIEALFEIDKGIARPKAPLQVLAGNQLAGMFQQYGQNSYRLAFQPDAESFFP
jgi:hypothetical protein